MAVEYFVADVADITLHQGPSGALWGADRKTFHFGPWNLDLWLEVQSDVTSDKEIGAWLSFTPIIWGYLWVTTRRITLIIFDAGELNINGANCASASGGLPEYTIANLRSSVKAVFEYHDDCKAWKRSPIAILDVVKC